MVTTIIARTVRLVGLLVGAVSRRAGVVNARRGPISILVIRRRIVVRILLLLLLLLLASSSFIIIGMLRLQLVGARPRRRRVSLIFR